MNGKQRQIVLRTAEQFLRATRNLNTGSIGVLLEGPSSDVVGAQLPKGNDELLTLEVIPQPYAEKVWSYRLSAQGSLEFDHVVVSADDATDSAGNEVQGVLDEPVVYEWFVRFHAPGAGGVPAYMGPLSPGQSFVSPEGKTIDVKEIDSDPFPHKANSRTTFAPFGAFVVVEDIEIACHRRFVDEQTGVPWGDASISTLLVGIAPLWAHMVSAGKKSSLLAGKDIKALRKSKVSKKVHEALKKLRKPPE